MIFESGNSKEHGSAISMDQLRELLTMEPRRHRLLDPAWHNVPWSALYAPRDEGTDWCLSFPFFETFAPAFDEFCHSRAEKIERLPFQRQDGKCVKFTYLRNASEKQLNEVGDWVSIISRFVAIRDFLRVSLALDYTRERGNPENGLTEIAKLRQVAKLYGISDRSSTETLAAATRLAGLCINLIKESRAYSQCDAVIAVSRSDPSKSYSLPGLIADRISKDLGPADLSHCIRTIKQRREMKDTAAEDRLSELEGTIEVIEKTWSRGAGY